MIGIKSFEFLKGLYKFVDHKNQGMFVITFLNAAGSKYFSVPKNKQHQTNEYLETERRYAINRPLSPEIKESFPDPINLEGLTAFINDKVDTNQIQACMASFGIPDDAEVRQTEFARALAVQFSQFVRSDEDDVENNVWEIYQTLLRGEIITADDIRGPRYAGDDAFVELNGRSIQANCYETIHHEWQIQNSGRVPWHDRKLVLMNGKEIRPRPVDEVVPLPDTAPGDHIKIATDIEARGIEGNFECKWEMQDADGQNCFPNKRWDFNTTILVKFQPSDKGEKRG